MPGHVAVRGVSMGNVTSPLGDMLRTWRDRLGPADVGLPAHARRRVTGLRREELAQLAGLSVDYVVRLEQGRALRPSAQVVGALARGLQLDESERDHLFRCSGLLPPSKTVVATHVPPGVQRLVARVGDAPVAVFSADWTLISCSDLWCRLMGDPWSRPAAERNLVRATFLSGPATPWPVRSERGAAYVDASLVADLRAVAGRYPDDRDLASLVAQCRSGNARFTELWDAGAVSPHLSDRKSVEHPVVGTVTLDCDVLTVPGADLRIVVYTAPAGGSAAAALDFLKVSAVPSPA